MGLLSTKYWSNHHALCFILQKLFQYLQYFALSMSNESSVSKYPSKVYLFQMGCYSCKHRPPVNTLSDELYITQRKSTVNAGSENGCTVQCNRKWPSASDLCISMFTVLSALLCFDNLSSQNSPRKSPSAGLHKCIHAQTHTRRQTERLMDG